MDRLAARNASLPFATAACAWLALSSVARANDLVLVPLRWTAMEGSDLVQHPEHFGADDVDHALVRRHYRATITRWLPGAGIVFRGALYRALNYKLPWYAAVLISAAAFGLVHPYSPEGLAQVALSGVIFALLREWRGSLIACITAHALHNGTISVLEIASINIING